MGRRRGRLRSREPPATLEGWPRPALPSPVPGSAHLPRGPRWGWGLTFQAAVISERSDFLPTRGSPWPPGHHRKRGALATSGCRAASGPRHFQSRSPNPKESCLLISSVCVWTFPAGRSFWILVSLPQTHASQYACGWSQARAVEKRPCPQGCGGQQCVQQMLTSNPFFRQIAR